ncbi:BNR-4 repeat-containing protein, partial [Candidatus Sumerlaeota bacterium]|nr:BNR-4 repeat-containing protein [Candidatus Sumerlaeota bacterium]
YYDHATGMVPRPTILLHKKTSDAHDNPTISLDDKGYIFIFSNSHGGGRPAYIHRSKKPFSVDDFDLVLTDRFSYSEPWRIPGAGFLFLHTRYTGGQRRLYFMTSVDGIKWGEPKPLSQMEKGHYQISACKNSRVGTAFNFHPKKGGLDYRTNLYYMETLDMGQSWKTVDGKPLSIPLLTSDSLSLVHNYQSENLLVYMKDMQFDEQGNPVILFLTSKGFESGPQNDPRTWRVARWNGAQWDINAITDSDNNYDFGSLYMEKNGVWKIIAPTNPGPQAYNTGGEIVLWESRDMGKSWKKTRELTQNSKYNHTYVRRPLNAHPDFYAFWADGHGREESPSALYFTDAGGNHVWRLPTRMEGEYAKPEMVK